MNGAGGVIGGILGVLISCLAVSVTGHADVTRYTMGLIPRRSMSEPGTVEVSEKWGMTFEKHLLEVARAGKKGQIVGPGSKETDFVEALPGQPKVDFKQYAGYVTVNDTAGKAFFYYFTEAVNSSLPLVLWLNGGPGCSSVGAGAFLALGPFRVNIDGKTLKINPDAWNQVANIIFLETPAGVGFSYSNNTLEDTQGDDLQTAKDNFQFLLNWFERFPEYKGRDFYIAGESYAGAYIPTLAFLIFNHNKMANDNIVNLKGIMLGNAYLGIEEHNRGQWDNLLYHGVISKKVHENLVNCDYGPICDAAANDMYGSSRALDFYNLYNPVQCNKWKSMDPKRVEEGILYNCTSEPMTMYLNRPEVQDALHVVPRPTKLWSWCNPILLDAYVRTDSILGYVMPLLNGRIPVMLYNGDADEAVPIAEARLAIKQIYLPIRFKTRPWFSSPIEVGGFTTVYEAVNYTSRVTFATVRGGSHMAPANQGPRSIHLIRSFLNGEQLPYSYLAPKTGYECC